MLFILKSCAENSSTEYQNSFSIKRYLHFKFCLSARGLNIYILYSIVIGIVNWMLIPYNGIHIQLTMPNKKRPNIIRYKRLNIF